METNFQRLMVKKTDKELEEYLINIMAYSREIVEAAINELKNRGRIFSDVELSTLETKVQERENTIGQKTITANDAWGKEIVGDENAVSLYSRRKIDIFTFIFGIIIGTILMIVNLYKTNKKKGIIPLIIFCIVYLIIVGNILIYIDTVNHSLLNLSRFGLNALGAIIIRTLFWNVFIGKGFKYRERSVWLPIILGIIIQGLFIYLWI